MPDPVTGVLAATSIGSSLISSDASSDAAQTQADAANRSADLQYQAYQEQKALQEPYREAGLTAQNRLLGYLGLDGGDTGMTGYGQYATAEFTPAMFASYQDPGYAWRMSEGMKALEKSAAARGGLLSGATMKGIQQYGQGLASEEYQNAFNRYQTTRANTLSPYFQLQNVGQNAASNTGAAAGQYASGASQALTSGAAATAAGQIGSANAWSSGLNTLGSAGTTYAYQKYLQNQALDSDINSMIASNPSIFG